MMKHLADHFKAARLAKGLTLGTLARLTGYPNARKVAGRIACFEKYGTIKDELLARLADALGIDYAAIERLLARDSRAASYALQRADGRYLTPECLCWSVSVTDAQRCDLDEAKAIQGWLNGIGIRVGISRLNGKSNFAQ
jgi:transcriptional regulator with XRE-family HTH domain